jgi:glycosyltransferase involved in cell wall biosynthesis
MLFPYGYGKNAKKLVYWKPDFQEKHLPEYFTARELKIRDLTIRSIAERGIPIVFSSYDSENDYKKFYPEYSNKTFVIHFAVEHADITGVMINDLKKKFGIKGDYLLCANQFWKHKNHLFLFKSYLNAVHKGFKLQLVCTGRIADSRNPDYIDSIMSFLRDNDLNKNIILTGLIETNELRCLMKNSYAIVQPSLFEGWNTTVEDCKVQNKFIFLSNIPVHREQMNKNVCFFDPYDENDLVNKLLTVKPSVDLYDYKSKLREFGEDFLKVIQYMSKKE